MSLHVSYMRSLCTTEWRTGRQMILSAVRHGVAKEFIKFCAGLRVNKRTRITLDRIRKVLARKQWPRWLANFSKEAYYVWLGMRRMALPQAAVPSGESTIAVMRADSRKLVHAVSPSHRSCLLQTRGHCSSGNCGVALFAVIFWCGWTTGGMPSFGPIR